MIAIESEGNEKEFLIMTMKDICNKTRRNGKGRAVGRSIMCTLAVFLLIVLISILCVWYFTSAKTRTSQPHNSQLVWRVLDAGRL
ncbi:MAG: hypothetical protein LUI87_11175 [Lachnospiraceae bacterium]|nr:hypothetical protein [Lachnospiraceae bacterium]